MEEESYEEILKRFRDLQINEEKEKKQPISKNPKGLRIRLYRNGAVYPSDELVNLHSLEYSVQSEDDDLGMPSYGYDVIDSKEWGPTKSLERTILLGIVPKKSPKVDLFATTRYTEDGVPIGSVVTQGTKSEKLLKLADYLSAFVTIVSGDSKTYTEYVEYQLDVADSFSAPVANIPKRVERGENKGKETYERRENITFYPLIMVDRKMKTVKIKTTGEVLQDTKNSK